MLLIDCYHGNMQYIRFSCGSCHLHAKICTRNANYQASISMVQTVRGAKVTMDTVLALLASMQINAQTAAKFSSTIAVLTLLT